MDVLVLIDKLDDLVHNAKAVPLTDQVRIDREEIYDILDQMRATIPEEIKQARWIVKERQEMLAEAKRETDRLLRRGARAGRARGVADGDRQDRRAPGAGHRRRGAAAGARDAARDGGLGRRDPLDARGQPREVPHRGQRGRERLHERSQEIGRRRQSPPASRTTNRTPSRLSQGRLVLQLGADGLRRLDERPRGRVR